MSYYSQGSSVFRHVVALPRIWWQSWW